MIPFIILDIHIDNDMNINIHIDNPPQPISGPSIHIFINMNNNFGAGDHFQVLRVWDMIMLIFENTK